MTIVFHAWSYGRFIEIQSNLRRKNCHSTNQGPKFLGGSLAIEITQELQSKRKSTPASLKILFPHIISTSFNRSVKQNHLSFSSNEINKPLPALVHRVSQIRFKIRSQFQLLPQIRCQITFRIENSIISIGSNITDNIIRKVINVWQVKSVFSI